MTTEKFLLVLMGLIIPPLPVFLIDRTILTKEFLVSVILTMLGHIPGILFSLYYILIESPKRGVRLDEERTLPEDRHEEFSAGNQESGFTESGYTDEPEPVPEPEPEPTAGSSEAPPSYNDVGGDLKDHKVDNKVQT